MKRLADIDPDMYSKMNEGVKDQVAFSMYLDQLLKKRMITTEEERLFVTALLDPKIQIPIFPIWDPDGNVMGITQWRAIMGAAAVNETSMKFGLFSKKLLGVGEAAFAHLGHTPQQRKIKAMILLHLLPELRESDTSAPVVIANNGTITRAGAKNEAQNFLEGYISGDLEDPLTSGGVMAAFRPSEWASTRAQVPNTLADLW